MTGLSNVYQAYFGNRIFYLLKDGPGKVRTYRNDFLSLAYGQGGTTDHDPGKEFAYSAVFPLGYLIRREGNFIDQNTFRLGAVDIIY